MMRKLIILLTLSVVFIAANLLAFRADDDPAKGQLQSVAPVLKAVPPKMPTAEQKEAARQLDRAKVEWDIKTGAPASIRGKDLSARNLGGKNLSLSAKNDFAVDAIAVMDRLTSVYRLRDASREFSSFKVDTDELGFHHVRINQMYQGLKIVGAELIVHFNKSGQAYQANGRYVPDIKIEMSAAYNFNNVQTYYYNTHSRDSYDNSGTQEIDREGDWP